MPRHLVSTKPLRRGTPQIVFTACGLEVRSDRIFRYSVATGPFTSGPVEISDKLRAVTCHACLEAHATGPMPDRS